MTAKKGTEIPKKTAAAVSAKTENVTAPAKESAVKEEAVKVEKAPAKKTAEPRKAAAKAAPKTTKTTKKGVPVGGYCRTGEKCLGGGRSPRIFPEEPGRVCKA